MAKRIESKDLWKEQEIKRSAQELAESIREIETSLENLANSVSQSRRALNQQSASQSQLRERTQQLSAEERRLQQIRRQAEATTRRTVQASEELAARRRQLREEVRQENEALRANNTFTQRMTQSFQNAALKVAGFIAIAKAVVDVLVKITKNTIELNKQTSKTAATFDVTREQAVGLTKEIRKLSTAYDQDFNEVLKASNILAQEFGITANESLELIRQGFEKGADINGEFLELLKEYPAQLRTVGLNAKETIAIITQTERAGVFSDKGIDAIKEAGIRLRELTPATREALDNIGLSSREIEKSLREGSKSLFEVTQEVSGQLAKLPPQSAEVGQAIADIFGGPGEDAGLRFLTTLKDIDTNLDDLDTTLSDLEQSQVKLKESWQSFMDSITDGDSIISKFISGTFNQLANTIDSISNSLNVLAKGTWADRLKVITNALLKSILFALKPVILIYERITGKKVQIAFDIPKLEEDAQEVVKVVEKTQKEITQVAEKESRKRVDLPATLHRQEIKPIEGAFSVRKALEEGYTGYLKEQEAERTRIREEEAEEQRQIDEENQKIRQELTEATQQVLSDQYSSFIDSRVNQTLEANEREQEIFKSKLDRGIIDEAEYNEEVKKLQLKQRQEEAKAEKKKALFDIFLQTVIGSAKAIAVSPATFGQPFLSYVVGQGAINAAVVAAKPIPKFFRGVTDFEGGMAIVGDSATGGAQTELIDFGMGRQAIIDKPTKMYLPKGTSVYPEKSKETQAVLSGMNDKNIIKGLSRIEKKISGGSGVYWTKSGLERRDNKARQRTIIRGRRAI